MQVYIGILRGINVSGQKMIKMPELKAHLEKAGLVNVLIYIQSGNVVFEYKKESSGKLQELIKTVIAKKFGFDVPVIVKTSEELIEVSQNNPFINKRKADIEKLHVTFLSEEPKKELLEKFIPPANIPGEYAFSGKAIYLLCPNGYGQTKLTNNFFENKLKVTATTRNWKTVLKLAEMAGEK
jgi:uncharacterized protein (DUF1697 family)